VDLKGLEWDWIDSHSNHLGLFVDNKLVSCMKISIFDDLENFSHFSQVPLPGKEAPPFYHFWKSRKLIPIFLGQGLHTLMRLAGPRILPSFLV